jgi:hypothetical protein
MSIAVLVLAYVGITIVVIGLGVAVGYLITKRWPLS